jgi:hypothetical protein
LHTVEPDIPLVALDISAYSYALDAYFYSRMQHGYLQYFALRTVSQTQANSLLDMHTAGSHAKKKIETQQITRSIQRTPSIQLVRTAQ